MNILLTILQETPGVLLAIAKGFFGDVKNNWWRYAFSLIAICCIINTMIPVGIPDILTFPLVMIVILATTGTVIMPAWEMQALRESYSE